MNRNMISEHVCIFSHNNIARSHFLMKVLIFRHFSFSIHLQKIKGVVLFLSPTLYQHPCLKWLVNPLRLCLDSCSEFISIQFSEYVLYFYCIWDEKICIPTFFFLLFFKRFWVMKSFLFFSCKIEHEGEKIVCIFKLI